ncbi:cytochrome c oxidase family protein [Penicillium macrosclerotiorum]|uniref:cytochrome c oxidase family protein n=1 Tax=Penicillium macrosclerotiorum TaxID=303699 RepID=UPI0025499695|nr:cytochrome c oxidase family protein [Penicillium macrosclerotiorum]KAJ5692754.1 cytochrome c oxidase family protein [Penicillium macrosclerotiorum]
MAAAIPPITGVGAPSLIAPVRPERAGRMLRRGLVLDLSTAFGFGTTFGYLWWYGTYQHSRIPPLSPMMTNIPNAYILPSGYHLPRVRERDAFYSRLEQERAAERA